MTEPDEPLTPAASDELSETGVPAKPHRPWWKQAISIGVTIFVLVLVFGFVLPKLADYRAVLDYIGDITTAEWFVLGLLTIWFLFAYPIVLVQALRTLRIREAFVNHTTGTAITNTLPSGGALALPVNYTIYMSWGFTPESISAGMLGVGMWDWLLRLSLPVVAVFGVMLIGVTLTWMWLVSLTGIAAVAGIILALATLLGSEEGAVRFAKLLDRVAARVFRLIKRDKPDVEPAVMQFRTDLNSIVKSRWPRLSIATIGNHVAMASLFTASVYAVGVSREEIPVPWVVLAFALGRFLVMIPVSPGGLGLVDLGWIGLLTLGWQTTSPGIPVDSDIIAAGVLLFRALSFLPPIVLGMMTWLYWRANKSWRQDWTVARRGRAEA